LIRHRLPKSFQDLPQNDNSNAGSVMAVENTDGGVQEFGAEEGMG
jgi:hypothetical protein